MLRRALVVATLAIITTLFPMSATAQNASRGEVFVGFQWAHRSTSFPDSLDIIGAVGEVAGYVNDWFGVSGEVGFARGEVDSDVCSVMPVLQEFCAPRVTAFSFGAGPRFRFFNGRSVAPSVRALVGAWRFSAEGESKAWLTTTLGAVVDVRVGNRVSIRAQPDLVIVYISEDDIEPMLRKGSAGEDRRLSCNSRGSLLLRRRRADCSTNLRFGYSDRLDLSAKILYQHQFDPRASGRGRNRTCDFPPAVGIPGTRGRL
jgi:hypothetical protein